MPQDSKQLKLSIEGQIYPRSNTDLSLFTDAKSTFTDAKSTVTGASNITKNIGQSD